MYPQLSSSLNIHIPYLVLAFEQKKITKKCHQRETTTAILTLNVENIFLWNNSKEFVFFLHMIAICREEHMALFWGKRYGK